VKRFRYKAAFGCAGRAVEIRARILSLHAVDWISGAVSASLSLLRKIAFPDSGDRCWTTATPGSE
jgi:hypothetical protein